MRKPAAKNQLPLKKKGLQLGAEQCPSISVWTVGLFLASTGNEKGVQRFLGWEDTAHGLWEASSC